MVLLQCRDLAFAYEGKTVLKALNFTVAEGDYLCVVGENGAGKSTLLKGLLRLLPPAAGTLNRGPGLQDGNIGYLPQKTRAQQDFPASVYEVVRSGCLNKLGWHPFYGRAEDQRVREKMALLDILPLKDRCFRNLSGGQQQRVLLARALCATGKLLLLDEPVTGLDPLMTAQFYKLLRRLHEQENLTIVAVSQDVRQAVREANKILHLGQGQLFFGSTEAYLQTRLGQYFVESVGAC